MQYIVWVKKGTIVRKWIATRKKPRIHWIGWDKFAFQRITKDISKQYIAPYDLFQGVLHVKWGRYSTYTIHP
jgi:hypothetical protein